MENVGVTRSSNFHTYIAHESKSYRVMIDETSCVNIFFQDSY